VRFTLSVSLDLFCKEPQVIHVILLFKLVFMHCDHVLFLLLPIKLLAFKFSCVLDLLALFLEALMRQVIDFLNVMDVLLAFVLGMVVDFEWALGSHEIWISLRVIVR